MNPTHRLIAQLVVSILVILPFWGFCFLLFFYGGEIHVTVKELLNTILMQVIPVFCGVVGYWLGTSLSSAAKDHRPSNPSPEAPSA